eukprot:TRINITY_DN815_c0_g2_i1.p1 TRINITY_DN815_c0_g2~~TRINITY_DN815_c0_g2_i1.p1  ORF type:complete len:547 (-),score=65.49 TRINITY_DN815_c0_g2_i1:41-1681(-)
MGKQMEFQSANRDKLRIKLQREERSYFSKLFAMFKNAAGNKVEKPSALDFFRKTHVPPMTVNKIWTIAAQTDPNSADRDEFYVALRLVGLAQSGQEVSAAAVANNVPAPLPRVDSVPYPNIQPSFGGMMGGGMTGMMPPGGMMPMGGMPNGMPLGAGGGMMPAGGMAGMMPAGGMQGMMPAGGMMPGDMSGMMPASGMPGMNPGGIPGIMPATMPGSAPAISEPKPATLATTGPHAIKKEDFQKYLNIYESVDTASLGYITCDQMTNLMKRTRIDEGTLGQVWEMSQNLETEKFDKVTTIIVLHILAKYKQGIPLPPNISPELRMTVQTFSRGGNVPDSNEKKDPFAEVAYEYSFGDAGSLHSYLALPSTAYGASYPSPGASSYSPSPQAPPSQSSYPAPTQFNTQLNPMAPSMPSMSVTTSSPELNALIAELQRLTQEKENVRQSLANNNAVRTREEEVMKQNQLQLVKLMSEYVSAVRDSQSRSRAPVQARPMPAAPPGQMRPQYPVRTVRPAPRPAAVPQSFAPNPEFDFFQFYNLSRLKRKL